MIKKVRELLGEARPKKSFGQNFLIDKNILKKIISTAAIKKTDNVLEVGPGLGFLTVELAKSAKRVIAVEKDKKMFEILEKVLADEKLKNVQLINQDILKLKEVDVEKMFDGKPYRIVANLPYNITSNFLRKFLEVSYPPQDMILMIQREVADRIVATPPNMSILSVSVQLYSEPRIKFIVKPSSFYPAPKVESAIIHLSDIRQNVFGDGEEIMKLVKQGFSQKRKQLKNNLKKLVNSEMFDKVGLSPQARAEELSVQDWVNLADKVK